MATEHPAVADEQKAAERIRRAILDRLNLPYDPAPNETGATKLPPRPFLDRSVKND